MNSHPLEFVDLGGTIMPILRVVTILGAVLAIQPAVSVSASPAEPWKMSHRADHPLHGIRWVASFDKAMSRARKEKKPVFLAFNVRRLADPDSPFR